MATHARTIAVTGAGSGLGAALVEELDLAGIQVLGVDLKGADISADLGTDSGRSLAIESIRERCGGRLDGLVVAAGVGPYSEPETIVSVNFFGSLRLLDGLVETLQAGHNPAAVSVSSIGAFFSESVDDEIVRACVEDDETSARLAAQNGSGTQAYSSVKRAVLEATQSRATSWGQAGVRLNAIVPGNMSTPMLDAVYATPVIGEQTRQMPVPLGRDAPASEVAKPAAFLLSEDASYVHGSVLTVDGGVLAGLGAQSHNAHGEEQP